MAKELKTFYLFSILSFSITFVFLGLVAYWMFWPVTPMVVENDHAITVDKEIYRPGDRITYTFKYCKIVDQNAVVSRSIVNSIRINFTTFYSQVTRGCGTVKSSDLVIPDFIDNGLYHIESTAEYKINPLRTIKHTWESVKFEIKK